MAKLESFHRTCRRAASGVVRYLLPGAEAAAWNRAKRAAEKVPRYTRGLIRLMDYDIEYVDLLTLCPQWHDLFVREALKVHLERESPRILDCGANVGLASMYFKRLYPRARITAFEADPGIVEILRGNLDRNRCGDVEVVSAAVWTENGTVEFCQEGADSGTIGEFAAGISGQRVNVASIRLRDILEAEEVDLLKLDIEGGEEAVLTDCAHVLHNVRALILDLHEFDAKRRRTSSVLEILERAGFIWSLDGLSPLPWRLPVASADSPFPGTHLSWAVLLRAWRV